MTTPRSSATAIPAGLSALNHEMSKQHRDALDSYKANGEVAAKIAASVKRTRRLILLGMGGSQAVNRTNTQRHPAQVLSPWMDW